MPALNLQQAFALAAQQHAAGQLHEAERTFRQIISGNPSVAEAHGSLGTVLLQLGRLPEAVAAYQRSVQIKPTYALGFCNLGNALREIGKLDEAVSACRKAIALNPGMFLAYGNLGTALADLGKLDEAIAAYQKAISLNPNYANAFSNLGTALVAKGSLPEAIPAFQQAVALNPNHVRAWTNLGSALNENGQTEAAITACRRAIALDPSAATAHNNLGNCLVENDRPDEAMASYHNAIALNPAAPEPHYSLANLLLRRGEFEQGWKEYEWRWQCKEFRPFFRSFPAPLWDGSDLTGRVVLLHAEQGLGDTVQFIRYASLVAERGRPAQLLVEAAPELRRLLQGMPGVTRFLKAGEPLQPFDVHCPLLSLPFILGTTLKSIPATVPYLRVEESAIEKWRAELANEDGGLKVGLVWAGGPLHKRDRHRSMSLPAFAPLSSIPNVSFYSLQKGAAAAQLQTPPAGLTVIDRTELLNDFADTAALIASLDLVISVDTSVAHIAGALGKPTWVLLPFVPDWRWMENRPDTPWYPTLRLFRQTTRGDWTRVIALVAQALAELAGFANPAGAVQDLNVC